MEGWIPYETDWMNVEMKQWEWVYWGKPAPDQVRFANSVAIVTVSEFKFPLFLSQVWVTSLSEMDNTEFPSFQLSLNPQTDCIWDLLDADTCCFCCSCLLPVVFAGEQLVCGGDNYSSWSFLLFFLLVVDGCFVSFGLRLLLGDV